MSRLLNDSVLFDSELEKVINGDGRQEASRLQLHTCWSSWSWILCAPFGSLPVFFFFRQKSRLPTFTWRASTRSQTTHHSYTVLIRVALHRLFSYFFIHHVGKVASFSLSSRPCVWIEIFSSSSRLKTRAIFTRRYYKIYYRNQLSITKTKERGEGKKSKQIFHSNIYR